MYLSADFVVGKMAEFSLDTDHSAIYPTHDVGLRVTYQHIVILRSQFLNPSAHMRAYLNIFSYTKFRTHTIKPCLTQNYVVPASES